MTFAFMNPDADNPYAPPLASLVPPVPPVTPSDRLDPIFNNVEWPLRLRFKFWTLSPKMIVEDATGREVIFVKQKLFRLKEHIELFSDHTRTVKLGEIKADRMIDWSAKYQFTDQVGDVIGSVGRKGWKSLWSAHYQSYNPGDSTTDFDIREENPIVKVIDGIVGQIPIIGILTVMLFHPKYSAKRADGQSVMRLTKQPAFLEGRFSLEKLGQLTSREQMNLILSFFMLGLLERRRG
jgi:hypothetical protein